MSINPEVRSYWEKEPCGTSEHVVGGLQKYTREWFEEVEQSRYHAEPFIHSAVQFTRHHGKKMLEVGVGAGTDHLQFARAGAICHGVDLTDAGIETTRARLKLYGLTSELRRVDAETLPFEDNNFDLVYSWGVIHHSQHPERIIAEIRRVLKPGGEFIGMLYNRHSLATYKLWVKHALLKGKPGRGLADVLWNHMESIGTKAYTPSELRDLFGAFGTCTTQPIMTSTYRYPFLRLFPDRLGFFIVVKATK